MSTYFVGVFVGLLIGSLLGLVFTRKRTPIPVIEPGNYYFVASKDPFRGEHRVNVRVIETRDGWVKYAFDHAPGRYEYLCSEVFARIYTKTEGELA